MGVETGKGGSPFFGRLLLAYMVVTLGLVALSTIGGTGYLWIRATTTAQQDSRALNATAEVVRSTMQDVQQQLVSAVQQELQHRDNHLVSQQQQQQQQQQQVQHLMQQLSDVISRIKGLSSTTAVDVRSQSNGQSNRQSNGQSNQQSNAQSTGHKRTAAARGVPSTRQSHSRLKLLKPPCTLAETIGINKTALQTLSEDAHRTLDYVQQLVFAHMKADKIILAGPPWVRDEDLQHVSQAGPHSCNPGRAPGLQLNASDSQLVAPVVVVAHNRPVYLAKTVMTILKYWTEDTDNARKFPLFISVDGNHQPTLSFAAALGPTTGIQVIQHMQSVTKCRYMGFCNLNMHYRFLLQLFFRCHNVSRLILVEDDLEIAPDFFSYFEATAPLLRSDPSLWCISAWNDHGQAGRASDNKALYRTDIMPGLGWMLANDTAHYLLIMWPTGGWDDWMRRPRVRDDHQCVYPEVSRTHTFGDLGTHFGAFFEDHLQSMLLNEERIDWKKQDLSYLHDKQYQQQMKTWLKQALPLRTHDLAKYCNVTRPVDKKHLQQDLLVTYRNATEFVALAQALSPMMSDLKGEDEPRCSYNGTVVVRCRGRRLFIAAEAAVP